MVEINEPADPDVTLHGPAKPLRKAEGTVPGVFEPSDAAVTLEDSGVAGNSIPVGIEVVAEPTEVQPDLEAPVQISREDVADTGSQDVGGTENG